MKILIPRITMTVFRISMTYEKLNTCNKCTRKLTLLEFYCRTSTKAPKCMISLARQCNPTSSQQRDSFLYLSKWCSKVFPRPYYWWYCLFKRNLNYDEGIIELRPLDLGNRDPRNSSPFQIMTDQNIVGIIESLSKLFDYINDLSPQSFLHYWSNACKINLLSKTVAEHQSRSSITIPSITFLQLLFTVSLQTLWDQNRIFGSWSCLLLSVEKLLGRPTRTQALVIFKSSRKTSQSTVSTNVIHRRLILDIKPPARTGIIPGTRAVVIWKPLQTLDASTILWNVEILCDLVTIVTTAQFIQTLPVASLQKNLQLNRSWYR